jgi:hypothetical protein
VVVLIVFYSQPTARVMEKSVQSVHAAQLAARPQLELTQLAARPQLELLDQGKTPNLYKVAVHTSLRKETREEQIFAAFLHQAQAEVAAEKLEKLEKANARLEKAEAKMLQEQEAKDLSARVRNDLHEARILTSKAGFQNVEQKPRRIEAKGTMKAGFRSTMAAHGTASTPPPSVIHAVSELQALLNATNKELQAVSTVQAHLRNSSAARAAFFTNISSSDISTSDSVLSPRPNIFKVEDANRTLSLNVFPLTLDSRTARKKISYRKRPLAEFNSSNMKADVGHKVRQDDAGAILQLGMHAHMNRTPFLFRVQTTTMLWIIVSVLAVLACTSTLRSQYKQRHDLAHFQSKKELSMITAEEYSVLM